MTITIGLIFALYWICFVPLPVYIIIISQIYTLPLPFGILLGQRILAFVHRLQNVINPVVYGMKNNMMKTAYRKMLCKNSVAPYMNTVESSTAETSGGTGMRIF